MASCSKCGAPYGPTSQFCTGCGTTLAQSAGSAAPASYAPAIATPPASMQIKKKKGKLLKIVGIVVAVFFALVIWGAISESGKNGGKSPVPSTESGESKPATAAPSASAEEQAKDGRLMCAEIQSQLKDYLKDSIKGIECKPGGETGGIALAVAYPLPLLAKDDLIRKNTLFMTFSIAGGAISRHSNTTVKEVYALDSSRTSFAVPGEFAQQLYTRMVNSQLSEGDGKEEVVKVAHRVTIPEKNH